MSHWTYNGKKFDTIPEDTYGFVYKITRKEDGKFYIGKKQFYSITRKKVPGRKNRKVITREMKWREYVGSCVQLQEDIKTEGKDKFTYEVLVLARTKGQLNFLEVVAQIKMDVLFKKTYNDSIGSGKYMSMKIDDRLKESVKILKG